ncbi:hypothetical protein ACOALA_08150 [Alicyclobacillus acidoterrestris]|uniref:Uncharacterized protein n=1 Tax=Alicyclobacillus acidoterrestris (strain ATCC 49025 / DSM 3922 / CIP 106132 / NCIMB 13137 / GD3B) TaxID=1356854 RepID=A0A9E6ZIF7_ALIAG|nr:hypothetical protein [Alicyclobacillus acidoterrestris]UNO47746.1 hypothetical protein K1I37_13740 [Alicyclobacillus acidoterrestris]
MDELNNEIANTLPFARAGGSEVNLDRAHQQIKVYPGFRRLCPHELV